MQETQIKVDVSSSDTTILVNEFLDTNGDKYTTLSTGDYFDITVKAPQLSETIRINSITYNSDGSAILGVDTNGRNISPTPNKDASGNFIYTGSSVGKSLSGGSSVIVSNSPDSYDFLSNDTSETITGKFTFNTTPIIPDAINLNEPVSLNQLNNVVVGAIGVATETSDGVVSKSNIDNYISGEGNRLPDSSIVNSPSYENPIDFIPISTNTFLVIGSDNNLYTQNVINGKTISTIALSTGTRTQTFSKIVYYTSQANILLLSSTNTLIQFTGNNTFVNIPFGSGSLSLPSTQCIKAKFGLNKIYLSFVGSSKIWIIDNNNVVTASPDLVLSDIVANQGYLYSFDIDFNNNIMYATAILDETGQNLQDNMLIYRINLSDSYSVSRYQGNINDLLATGSLKNIVFWKNTPTKALLIVNNCNLSSIIVPTRNNYVTLYTCPLPSQPFTGIVRTNLYNMIASNSWNSNSASLAPNLQKLSNLIIGDTQFFLSYPIQNGVLSTSAELFYNNLLVNTPACITPDVSQVLTSSDLTITARKSNYNFSNVKTTFAGGTLSISPPIITGQVRNDLIVINSSGNLQARLGNPTNGNLGQAVSGDIILGECQTQYQTDTLKLINYDNYSVYKSSVNNLSTAVASQSFSIFSSSSISIPHSLGKIPNKITGYFLLANNGINFGNTSSTSIINTDTGNVISQNGIYFGSGGSNVVTLYNVIGNFIIRHEAGGFGSIVGVITSVTSTNINISLTYNNYTITGTLNLILESTTS